MEQGKTYQASHDVGWRYVGIDEPAPSGKLLILTKGGICIIGDRRTEDQIAWSPMPKRNKSKEQTLHLVDQAEAIQESTDPEWWVLELLAINTSKPRTLDQVRAVAVALQVSLGLIHDPVLGWLDARGNPVDPVSAAASHTTSDTVSGE